MMAMSSTTPRRWGKSSLTTGAALAAFCEFVGRAEQLGVPLDEREFLVLEQRVGARLQVVLDELGLVVEQILLRRPARHVQIDDLLGLGGEMGRPGLDRVVGRWRADRRGRTRRRGSLPRLVPCDPEASQGQWRPARPETSSGTGGGSAPRANCNFQGRSKSMRISLWSRRHRDSRVRWRRRSRRPARPAPCRAEAARAGRWPGPWRP